MMYAITKAAVNAAKAVRNQPPITDVTPATLYTALSLPHAPSAKDVPIATMNVTYVVDKGSFSDVANDIRILATVRFTEALRRSKDD